MPGITSTGLGSGLDINGIVDKLVAAERAPAANRLTERESKANTELSALGKFKSALSAFQDSLSKVSDAETFQGRVVTAGDEEVFTATASNASRPGHYEVEVKTLATGQRLSSTAFADATSAVGTGTITITVNGKASAIAIAGAATSLNDIRNAINDATDNPGVRATIVNASDGAHLILSATKTGVANGMTIAVSGGDGGLASLNYAAGAPANGMTQLQAAADATLLIDGFAVTSAENSVSDAIDGVTINLLSAKPGTTVSLAVDYDPDGARTSVNNFVAAYNQLIDTVKSLTSYNPDTRDAGPLLGDPAVRGIRDQLRRAISSTVGEGAYTSLASIGVTTQIDGKLAVDATRLDAAIDADFEAVGSLFGGNDGLAKRLSQITESTLSSGSTIAAREASLKTTLKGISTQRDTLDDRIGRVRERLQKEFNAMDTLLAKMKQTSTYLAQQLG